MGFPLSQMVELPLVQPALRIGTTAALVVVFASVVLNWAVLGFIVEKLVGLSKRKSRDR